MRKNVLYNLAFCFTGNSTVQDHVTSTIHQYFSRNLPILIALLFQLGDREDELTKHAYDILDTVLATWDRSVVSECSQQVLAALFYRIHAVLASTHQTFIKDKWLCMICGLLDTAVQSFQPNAFSKPNSYTQQLERDSILQILLQVKATSIA